MFRSVAGLALSAGVLLPAGMAAADQPKTADAAMNAAARIADCPGCEFYFGPRPQESARRGLADIGIEFPEGGDYHILLAYTGTRWGRLWEGNGSTQNLYRLPGRMVICMDPGGWTNIRTGPGLNYRRVGMVTRPTVKKALRLDSPNHGQYRRRSLVAHQLQRATGMGAESEDDRIRTLRPHGCQVLRTLAAVLRVNARACAQVPRHGGIGSATWSSSSPDSGSQITGKCSPRRTWSRP